MKNLRTIVDVTAALQGLASPERAPLRGDKYRHLHLDPPDMRRHETAENDRAALDAAAKKRERRGRRRLLAEALQSGPGEKQDDAVRRLANAVVTELES